MPEGSHGKPHPDTARQQAQPPTNAQYHANSAQTRHPPPGTAKHQAPQATAIRPPRETIITRLSLATMPKWNQLQPPPRTFPATRASNTIMRPFPCPIPHTIRAYNPHFPGTGNHQCLQAIAKSLISLFIGRVCPQPLIYFGKQLFLA